MTLDRRTLLVCAFSMLAVNARGWAESLWMDSLDLSYCGQLRGTPQVNKSQRRSPLSLGGTKFEHGMGTHAPSQLDLAVNGATHFTATVGIDDAVTNVEASIIFRVIGDHKTLFDSGVIHHGQPPQKIDIDVSGVKKLRLYVDDAGDGATGDDADWCDAKFDYTTAAPAIFQLPHVDPYILTPEPPQTPRINGASVLGARLGHWLTYRIPATGKRPMQFSVDGLPAGLTLDSEKGIITGSVAAEGEHKLTLHAKNELGEDRRAFKLVIGPNLALTPPMGWNSWNAFGGNVSDADIRRTADFFEFSGLADHGWNTVNIDEGWNHKPSMPNDPVVGGAIRNEDGTVRTNSRFPDMKGMTDYVHAKGLKVGIYSSPGPTSCGGYTGSYQHEQQDAKTWADWGFDYLKYDWCSYGPVATKRQKENPSLTKRATYQEPYQIMHDALAATGRDFVFSLCQYGMEDVQTWGPTVGGNLWRTTGDIMDNWASVSMLGFTQGPFQPYAGPGHWNDPDMLVVGDVVMIGKHRPTRLTPDEQYTHISLWSLLGSPLLIGTDLAKKVDPFTMNLLTNDEVLAIDQDSLGHRATKVDGDGDLEIWARDLADGGKAVGLFNRGDETTPVRCEFSKLKLTAKQTVRDLWRQKTLGDFSDLFQSPVPPHGVVLIKLTPTQK